MYNEFKQKASLSKSESEQRDNSGTFSVTLGKLNNTLGIKAASQKVTGQKDTIEYSYVKKMFYENVSEMENLIFEVLKFVDIELFFDDFDEIKGLGEDERSEYLSNFIDNAERINSELRGRKLKSRVVLLIRDDYLVSLNSRKSNMQKNINDNLIELDWDSTNNKDILSNMILNKIKQSNLNLKEMTIEEVRKRIFPDFTYNAASDVVNTNGLKEIMKYTLHRPRDFVVYINEIIKANPNKTAISNEMILKCQKPYSEALVGEMQNEMETYYTEAEISESFNIISLYGKRTFTMDQLLKKINVTLPDLTYDECKVALERLYKFNVIGNKNRIKKEKRTIFSFNYRNYNPTPLNLDERIEIHRGFCSGLNIG